MDFSSRMTRRKLLTRSSGAAGIALVAAACGTDGTDSSANAVAGGADDEAGTTSGSTVGQPAVIDPATIPRGEVIDFGPAPDVPDGPLSEEVAAAVALLYGGQIGATLTQPQRSALLTIGDSGDPRLAWLLSDHIRVYLRIAQSGGITEEEFFENNDLLEAVAGRLTGQTFPQFGAWNPLTNALIGWDIPELPTTSKASATSMFPLNQRGKR